MLYTVNTFASCTVRAQFEFQPYIMKIYSLCIRAREYEEVEKKYKK